MGEYVEAARGRTKMSELLLLSEDLGVSAVYAAKDTKDLKHFYLVLKAERDGGEFKYTVFDPLFDGETLFVRSSREPGLRIAATQDITGGRDTALERYNEQVRAHNREVKEHNKKARKSNSGIGGALRRAFGKEIALMAEREERSGYNLPDYLADTGYDQTNWFDKIMNRKEIKQDDIINCGPVCVYAAWNTNRQNPETTRKVKVVPAVKSLASFIQYARLKIGELRGNGGGFKNSTDKVIL